MDRTFTTERRKAAKHADVSCAKNPDINWDDSFNKELERLIDLTKKQFQNKLDGKSKKRGPHKYAGEVGFVKPRTCSGFLHSDFHP
jgi:hypothetical protein